MKSAKFVALEKGTSTEEFGDHKLIQLLCHLQQLAGNTPDAYGAFI